MNEKTGVDVVHAIDQGELALSVAGLPVQNIFRRELREASQTITELLEAAKVLHERFTPIRDDLIFSKRMALDRLGTAILICTAPAIPKDQI